VRFTSGGRLAPESRKELIDSARRIFKSTEAQQNQTTNEFRNLAIRNNLDPNKIIRDVGLVQVQPGAAGESGITKSGNRFRRK